MTHALDALSTAYWSQPVPLAAWFHLHLMEHVKQWMRAAGCPVLFALLFSCGVGLPLPEDVPLLLAGFFVATHEMSLLPAAVCAWCGIIGGDCVLYAIGRRYGMGIKSVPVIGRHIHEDQIARLHDYFEKYGVWVVAVGRLFAGVRGAMVLVAGTIRFTFVHFIIADGIAAIFSGGLFMALGYYAGRKAGGDLHHVHELIALYSTRILLVFIGVGVIALAWTWWRKRARRRARPALVGSVVDAPPVEVQPTPPTPAKM